MKYVDFFVWRSRCNSIRNIPTAACTLSKLCGFAAMTTVGMTKIVYYNSSLVWDFGLRVHVPFGSRDVRGLLSLDAILSGEPCCFGACAHGLGEWVASGNSLFALVLGVGDGRIARPRRPR